MVATSVDRCCNPCETWNLNGPAAWINENPESFLMLMAAMDFCFPSNCLCEKKALVHSSSEDHPSTFSPPQFPFSLINYLHIYRTAQYLTLSTGFDGPNQMPYSTTNTTIGGLPPPPGVIPNFVNPYSRGWLSILTIVICLTLTTLLIGIRICTKFLITRSHGWEDCEYIFLS